VPTAIDATGVGRYAPEIETAVYFCCLEAMQNAMKHAHGLRTISVSLAERDDLRFEVSDDGHGFVEEELGSGTGISSMHDRLAAVGGLLTIATAAGVGTKVMGVIPTGTSGPNGANGAHAGVSAASLGGLSA
jgi:signal transduction histidine kinase